MNPAALFAAHRTAILGTAAAAVTGLALLRKRSGAAKTATTTAGATVPGTIPAGAVTADGYMGPDSSAYDVYNALQPELEALRQTVGGSVGPVPPPAPTSPLLRPVAPMPHPVPGKTSWWQPSAGPKTVRPAPPRPAPGGVVGHLPKYMP